MTFQLLAPLLERPAKRDLAKALLIEADCLNSMKHIPSKSVNLVLCDLPYGTTQNAWDSIIDLDLLWAEYNRILTPTGAVVLMGQGPFTAQLIRSNLKDFRYKIVWIKSKATNFLNVKRQPLRRHEDICIFYKSQPTYNPVMSSGQSYDKGTRKKQLTGSYGDFKSVEVKSKGGRYPSDVIYYKTAESEGAVYHSTQKPIELGRYLVKTFTNPGDVILDNAFGSGSFLIASVIENRKCIGIEINKAVQAFKMEPVDMMEIAYKRLREHLPKSSIFSCTSASDNFIRAAIYDFLA